MKEFFTGLLRDLTSLPGILFLVGVAAVLLVYVLYLIGKALPDPKGSAAEKEAKKAEAPAKPHAPADDHKKDDHHPSGGHEHHHTHPLKELGGGLASIAIAGLLFLALAFGVVYLYKSNRHDDSFGSSSSSSVSTDFVATKAPVGSWKTIKGVPGYHIEICRASDPTCAERSPIGFRMRCVNLEGNEVDWTLEACEGFLRLKVQSTGKKPLPIIWRYRPK